MKYTIFGRFTSVLLAFVMVIGEVPVYASADVPLAGEIMAIEDAGDLTAEQVTDPYDEEITPDTDGGSSVKKLQLGASALADNAGASGAATVYYGKNNQTWRVIGYGTTGVASTDGKLAMLAGSAMGSPTKFNEYSSGQDCNNYAGSLLKNAVDAIYSSTYFTEKEMGAIIKRDLNVQEYSATAPYTDGISGTALTGDNAPNLWPLSTKEAYTLYNNRSGITNIGDDWWLRSPGDNVICAAYVNWFDNVLAAGDTVDFDEGVRPAFNINLSSIILTSAASGGKSSGTTGAGALTAPDNYTGNEWKLTVNDTSRSGFAVNRLGSGKIAAGGNMRFNYRGAKKADNEYVSAILLDGSGSLLAYGRIVNTSSSTSGTSYITLPSTLVTDGNTYTLQFISEQYHTNKSTDYSSLPSSNSITFTAGKGTPTAVDFNVELPTDTTYDGSQKSATVTAETGVSGMGNITVKYKDADNNVSTSAPTDPGTYQILLDVAAGTYYDAADNITDDDWTFTISTAGTVATPTFSPAAGTYSTAQNVAISCTTDGATIHYTTDGSTPTASSQTYSSPIPVSETTTIKAVAAKSGMEDSDVASAEYTINHTDKTITGLCTGAIGNPTSGAGGWSYVYYGKYGTNAMKYRVLDIAATQYNTNTTMLLDCDSTIVNKYFDDDSNVWADSEIKRWLNEDADGFYGNANVFTSQEKAAIAVSAKNGASGTDGQGWSGTLGFAKLENNEKIFLLDAVEATNTSYGYANTDSDSDTRKKSGTNTWWWLRSPSSDHDSFASYVDNTGGFTYGALDLYNGVSPAFNLNLSSVIFSSLIPNKTNEYKLTVKDTNMTIAKTDGFDVTRAGNVVTVPYTITGGTPTQVSVLITDEEYSAGIVPTSGYSYQKLNVTTWGTSGTGTFTLPDSYADKTCGTDYYAYILAEDINGDRKTDYASTPVSITVPQKPILTISANDITLEYNGQTQGPGDTVYEDPAAIAKLVTVTGLLDGDTLTSITIDGQGQDVGDYELTPSQAAISNGGTPVSDKYDIKYVAGTLHIVPIPKNLQLGASALAYNAGASGAATVYYGKNNQTWRVIGYGTTGVASTSGKLALLAGSAMGSLTKFNEYSSEQDCNNYAGSLLKNAVDEIYTSDTCFSSKEKTVIVQRELSSGEYDSTHPYDCDGISGTALTGDNAPYLWPLSTKEAYTLYDNGSGITNIGDLWWLRSPGVDGNLAAFVQDNGIVYCGGCDVSDFEGVRPAFNINLSSILFTSAAVDGKKTETLGTLTAPSDYTGTDWKLTIKDPSLVINPGNAYKSGDTVTVSYTFTGSPNRISVLITDKDYTENDAKIKYYGAIAEGSSLGKSATFTLPGDVADTDKLYLLAETVNGDKRTDIASVPVLFSIGTLRTYTVAFDANGGTGRMDSVTRSEDDGNSLPVNRFVYPRRKFTGWNTKKDGTGRSYPDGYKGNVLKTDGSLPFPGDTMTLYAQWDWGEIPEDIRTDIFKNDMSNVRERDVWFAFKYDNKWHEDTAALKKTYTGEKITFTEDIAVFHGFWKLWENRDYTISYSDNTKAAAADAVKAPAVTIKGRGSYTARSQHKFTIEAVDINRAEVTSEEVIVVKTGTKIGKTKPAALYDGKKLRHGSDYETVFYEGSEIDASKEIKDKNLVLREKDKTYLVTIKGKGNFRDEKKAAIIKTADPKDRNTVRVSTLKVTDTKGKKLKIKIPYDELTKKGTVSGNFAEYIKGYFDNSKTGAKAQLMDGKNVLVYGRDYTVSAPEGGSAGTYRIVINGTGDQASGKKYIGTKSIKAEVTGTKMSSVKIAGLASRVGYLGRDIGLADVFDKNDKKLESGWEEVTLYAAGKDGTKKKLARSSDGVTGDYILTMVNTGAASRTETYLCPVVRTRTVTDDDGTQRQETYISWEPRKIEKGGRFLFIVTGINGYTGTVSRTVRIRPYNINEGKSSDKKIKVTIDDSRCEYSKSGAFPIVTVSFNGIGLREGIDYKLTFKNNKKVAADLNGMKDKDKPAVMLKGLGNFKGKLTGGCYRIAKSALATAGSSVKLNAQDVSYNEKGKAGYFIVKPVPMDGTYKLKEGKNGDIEPLGTPEYVYENAVTLADGTVKTAGSAVSKEDKVPAGTIIRVSVNVKCREDSSYSSEAAGTTMSCTYSVIDKPRDIKHARVSITKEAEKKLVFNNGYAIQLEADDFDVMMGNTKLDTSCYEIESVKNVSLVGRATVVLRGRNGYGGTKKYSFSIGKMQLK